MMNEVGAKEKGKKRRSETPKVDIEVHIGVFFDGTNNNANNNKWYDWFKFTSSVEKDHALNNTIILDNKKKISNPAILSSLFISKDNNHREEGIHEKYLHVYIEGSGANGFQAQNKILDFVVNGKPVVGLGFGLGETGVVAKVSKAVKYIGERIKIEEKNPNTEIKYIHFYVFGFSRGSACARLFSFLVARSAGDAESILEKEEEFDKYLTKSFFKDGKVSFLEAYMNKMSVEFLGIYDTVSAIGFLKEEDDSVNKLRTAFMYNPDFWGNFHRENSKAYGLFSPQLSNVKSTCHICAMDEFRANFALTDLGSIVKDNSIELFIPGCHSDVGGGYIELSKAEKKTLLKTIDEKFTQMCVNNPTQSQSEWKPLSIELLKELGWIDDSGKEVTEETDEQIDIVHTPRPHYQYSNIPLQFMFERAIEKAPKLKELFSKYPESIYPIPGPESGILYGMWKDIKRFISLNGRYCYLFGGKYSSLDYRQIRQSYLHFTSTDTLHGFGDPGNPPGRKAEGQYSNICRLVYRGERNDTNVHYMQDYNDMMEMI